MTIEGYLVENLIDIYAKYCEYAENMSEEEFDALFDLENGEKMSDLDFLLENSEDVLNEEVIEELYCYLIDPSAEKEYTIEQLVNFLAGKYYIFNYDEESSVIKFLKNSSIQDIINLFIENISFGTDMVESYFKSLCNKEKCNENRQTILENGDADTLARFETANNNCEIITLNNLLRKIVYNLYNHYICNGCGDVEALSLTWEYFSRDFDPLGELDQMGVDITTKEKYKLYLLGLIYADLYEDVSNYSIIQSVNTEDQMANVIPILSVKMGTIAMPQDPDDRNRLLKHFILLQDDKEKMKANRQKTKDEGRIKELKKVNPFYLLDELTF